MGGEGGRGGGKMETTVPEQRLKKNLQINIKEIGKKDFLNQ